MATKKIYADVQLMNSVMKDKNGDQISLTSAQYKAVAQAKVSGTDKIDESNPLVTQSYLESVVSDAKDELRTKTYWRDPVNTVSTETIGPSKEVNSYLNLTDKKIYRSTTGVEWDVTESPKANWCLVARDSDEQYTYNEDELSWKMTSTGAIPDATKTSKGKSQIGENIDVENGIISVKSASTEHKGVVQLAEHNESSDSKALQSNDPRIIVGHNKMSFTAQEIVTFVHNLGSVDVITQVLVDGKVVDSEITITDENTVTVNLSEQLSGKVLVIAI